MSSAADTKASNRGFLSVLFFAWMTPMMELGSQRPLQTEDVYDLPEEMHVDRVTSAFQSEWQRRVDNGPTEPPSLIGTMYQLHHRNIIIGFLYWLSNVILSALAPIFMMNLIQFLSDSQRVLPPSLSVGIGWAIAQYMAANGQAFGLVHARRVLHGVATELRTGMRSALFRKSLKLSPAARSQFAAGTVVNLMSNDCEQLMFGPPFVCMAVMSILQFIAYTALLLWLLGLPALAGLAVIFVALPALTKLMSILREMRVESLKFTDQRMKLTNEILQGIKVLKLNAWEESYAGMVTAVRDKEVDNIQKQGIVSSAQSIVFTLAPTLMMMITYMVLSLSTPLQPSVVFATMNYFSSLTAILMMIPNSITGIIQMRVSINRMQNFLLADELDENAIVREDKPIPNPNGPTPLAIAVDSAAFRWEVAPTESSTTESKAVPADVLTNISLHIPVGSLTVIVGAVGAGKSSLLQGLIGEIKRTAGSVRVHGSVAYCAQQAWIQSASLRDNILFGTPFDQAKFDSVVEACALTRDLEVLTDGERTEIGEKGINLSGGQKQRVNIARGVYSGADVVLLDDPLSAVDAHVAQHLFQRCICEKLSQKTRILVTHQLSFVSEPGINQIVVIKDNTIFEQGTYSQLMSRPDGELCRLVSEFVKSNVTDDNLDTAAAEDVASNDDSEKPSDASSAMSTESVTHALTEKLKRQRSNSLEVVKPEEKSVEPVNAQPPAKAQLVEEKRVTGSVKSDVYWHYLMATNSQSLSLLLILSIVCAQAIQVLITQFMAWWTSDTFHQTTYFYISVYGAMNAGNILLVVLANIVLTYVAARASRQFHDRALASVLRAPMTFFDTVPLGRVLNRFSGDLSSIDSTVPTQFISFFMALLGIVCMLCNMIAIFYYMIIPLIPLAWLCIYINNFFRHSSIEFQRMSSISKSPVLAHFGEMLSGLPTIRAYHEQAHFIAESNAKMSINQTMSYTQTLSVLWLSIRLQLVAAFVSGCTAGLSLYFAYKGYEVGLMALVLQYGLSLNSNLGPLFNQFVMLENGMNSVERLKEYSDELPHEAARHSDQCKTADNVTVPLDAQWPRRGSVVFDNIQMRYRPELPLVLDNVSLRVDSGQLIGVVGRTGAGKSSLMSALFRLIELESGRILVDDVDISSVGLAELRQRLAIIPQDPVLYGGTVRSNLDPFGAYPDQDLWASLEAVSLASAVRALDGELGAAVSENGENFSVGQKSQLCLARALLRRAKVLVLDEATASIDMETDALIQRTLRASCIQNGTTLLTIAHRLNTIIDYDKVLVMSFGKVVEFDSPANLLRDEKSHFSLMLAETGAENSAALRLQAFQAESLKCATPPK